MRILFLTHRLPYPPNRGDRIRAYHLLRVLARSADVQVLSLVHSATEDEHAEHLRELASIATVRVQKIANLAAATAALPGTRPLTHVLLNSSEVGRTLQKIVTDTPPDVVLAYCSGMAQYVFTPPLSAVPFVLDMVDVDSEKWAALGECSRWPMRSIYRREAGRLRQFEKQATARAAMTTVVNDRERTAVLAINAEARVRVLSNGIDADYFRPETAPSDDPNVVFCGVLNYRPNEMGAVWLAKEVWPLVLREVPRATLTLVGMDPTNAVRQLASDPSITVTGAVPDVRPYLWRSAAAVAPLTVARGLQNKVLEAIAAGLPCVVTPAVLEGLPESVRPACERAATAPQFAHALVDLLRVGPRDRRAKANAACLDSLTWETRLTPMLDVLCAAAQRTTFNAELAELAEP
jgi:sugar transferase (PEP-CTERM/EpsH1 system associated)